MCHKPKLRALLGRSAIDTLKQGRTAESSRFLDKILEIEISLGIFVFDPGQRVVTNVENLVSSYLHPRFHPEFHPQRSTGSVQNDVNW